MLHSGEPTQLNEIAWQEAGARGCKGGMVFSAYTRASKDSPCMHGWWVACFSCLRSAATSRTQPLTTMPAQPAAGRGACHDVCCVELRPVCAPAAGRNTVPTPPGARSAGARTPSATSPALLAVLAGQVGQYVTQDSGAQGAAIVHHQDPPSALLLDSVMDLAMRQSCRGWQGG